MNLRKRKSVVYCECAKCLRTREESLLKGSPQKRPRRLSKTNPTYRSKKPVSVSLPPDYQSNMQLDDLPEDCLLSILHFVPIEQLNSLQLVSSRWYSLSQVAWKSRQELKFWSVLERTWRKYGDVNFEPQIFIRDCLSRCGEHLTSLSFAECPAFRMSRFTVELIGRHCPNLESLDLSGRLLPESAIQGLLFMPKLSVLSLTKCFESTNLAYEARKNIDRSLGEVLSKLTRLRSLNMRGNRGIGTQGGKLWFSQLKVDSLNVIGTGLSPQQFHVFCNENAQNWREFRASETTFTCGSYWYSLNNTGRDVHINQLSKNLVHSWVRNLQRLELCDFTVGFEDEFKSMMRSLPALVNLVEVRLTQNKLITDEILAQICCLCRKLRTVSVAGCPVTVKGLDCLNDLEHLRHLDLSKLKCITDILLVNLSLKMMLETISLVDCGSRFGRDGLLALVLNCPSLRRVDVRNCKRVTVDVVRELKRCKNVEFLFPTWLAEIAVNIDHDYNSNRSISGTSVINT